MRKKTRHGPGPDPSGRQAGGAGHRWFGGWRPLAAGALVLALTCTGCAGLGMTSREVELLEAATAEARFVDRAWAGLEPGERRDFVRANALRWGYFNDLAQGRRPALTPDGRPVIRPVRAEGGAQDE